jgi:hypothetical protein
MKNIILILAVVAGFQALSQNIPPQAINFQGIAIDKNGIPVPGMDELGNPIQNSAIRVRFSIISGSSTGSVSYEEEHLTTTDEFGRFNLEIGRGTATSGLFTNINWGGDKHFLQVEVDLSALGTNYILASVQEFISVPYALYAKSAGSSSGDGDSDPTNELQDLVLSGNLLSITNGNAVTLPTQTLTIVGSTLTISGGNSVVIPDAQTLILSGQTLSISNGNSVSIPDAQTLSLSGSIISISNGNSVTLPANTDNQTLSVSGNTLSILNGNNVTLPSSLDNDTTNELQNLALNGNILSITGGNSVNIGGLQGSSNSSMSMNCIEGGVYLDLSNLAQLFTSTSIVAINNSKAIVGCFNSSGQISMYSINLNTNQASPFTFPSTFSGGSFASNDSILFLMSGTQVHAINYNSGVLLNSSTLPTASQGNFSVDHKTNTIYLSGINVIYRYSPLALVKITASGSITPQNNIVVLGQDSILINSTLYNGINFIPLVGVNYPSAIGDKTYNPLVGRLYYKHYDANTTTYELRSCNKLGLDIRTLTSGYQSNNFAYNGNADIQPFNKCYFGNRILLSYSGRVMPINNYFISSATIAGIQTNGFGGYKVQDAKEYLSIDESRWIERLAYNLDGNYDFYMVNNRLIVSFNQPYHCHNGAVKGVRGVAILN